MIELCLLGPQALRGSDGQELSGLPAQPKRFALLAYLALAGSDGYHRRDTLAAIFWPDLDQFAARRALRNTIYHLREALGDGVIVTRGDDVVAIDPAMLASDVTRLGEAFAAGRHEEVVERYRGELLAGVHFANAGEGFEEWLSRERMRISDLVMRALRSLVEREDQAGNIVAAAHWAQRACALAPGDESWLRRAMTLLHRGGDVGGALRLYDAFTRRLAAEFDAKPSSESEELAGRIRSGTPTVAGSRSVRATASPEVPPGNTAAAATPSPPVQAAPVHETTPGPAVAATPERDAPTRRAGWRRMALVVGVAGVIVAGVIVVRAMNSRAPVIAARQRVLVAVFANHTGDSTLQSLGRMTQDWLSQGLVRTQLVDVADPQAVFVQGQAAGGNADPIALARRTGAAIVVSGNYYRTGDTLVFQAAVIDVRSGRIVRVVGPILSNARTPVAGLDELRSRVMSALAATVDAHATQSLGSGEVPPFDAYRDYVDGWDAYWHGDHQQADSLFLRAAHRDTAFSAAALAAAISAANSSECPLVDSLVAVLDGRPGSLDRADQLTLQIADARCRGRNDEMLRLTLERADLLPGNSSAQLSAAAAALWANRPKRALALLGRIDPAVDLAWSTDTTHFAYWSGFTEALHLLGRYRDELDAADHMSRGAPLARAWFRGSALAAMARPTEALALIDSSLQLPVETESDLGLAPYTDGRAQYTVTPAWVATWIARELAFHGDTVAARQAARRAVTWYRNRPPEERATYEERLVAAWSLGIIGANAEAQRIARQLIAEDSANVDYRGELAALAAEHGDTALADSLDRWLAAQTVARVSWTASAYRAQLAALMGKPDSAIARVRDALDDGAWPLWFHQEPALVTGASRAGILALLVPRG